MKFQFIEVHKQEYAVKTMCRVLSVSECVYYARRKRPKSGREQKNGALTQHIGIWHRCIYFVKRAKTGYFLTINQAENQKPRKLARVKAA